jgi:prolyl-tRNA editing enzyme YbaK/EbsC (Cys-tRNA(Pro) deacylase)
VIDQNALDSKFFSSRQVSKARGGVAPIGWINQPKIIIIDQALNDYEVVWAAAGHPHAVYPTTFNELLKFTSARPLIVGETKK